MSTYQNEIDVGNIFKRNILNQFVNKKKIFFYFK